MKASAANPTVVSGFSRTPEATTATRASTADRIRIVYMAHAFMVGGAEEMVLNLVRRLPARFAPMVCCTHHAGPIGEELRATGVPFTVLDVNPGWRRPAAIGGIRRYLRAARPHIVHTFLLTASVYGRLAAILERVPIVIGTEVNIYERKRAHHVLAERMLMAGTDRVIASASSVRDFYIKQVHADPRKVDVIYNAVDFGQAEPTETRRAMREALGIPPDALVAGTIGRLTEQKGHRYLLDAIAAPELAAIHLLVVGGGELLDDLVRRTRASGTSDRVHFAGARRDLGNLLGAMDVFVMPSLWEGLPLSLVLAMGAGLPVVATSVAGMPEVIDDGRTGVLVPPGDSAALASALARLFNQPRSRARMAHDGRQAVLPRFGVDQYVNSVVALYDRLLGTRAGGAPDGAERGRGAPRAK
jgi:glycosyltransferase involved in cell wall biosynthesis